MKKKILLSLMVCVLAAFTLGGCASKSKQDADQTASEGLKQLNADTEDEHGAVTLKFWCDESELAMFQQRIDQFIEESKSEASIEVACEPVGASICKDTFLGDIDNGADVFYLPDGVWKMQRQRHLWMANYMHTRLRRITDISFIMINGISKKTM